MKTEQGKTGGLWPSGSRAYRWNNNIKIHILETACLCTDWIYLAQDCKHENQPPGSMRDEEFLDKLSDY